jgi:hypothetical protein
MSGLGSRDEERQFSSILHRVYPGWYFRISAEKFVRLSEVPQLTPHETEILPNLSFIT